MKKLIRNLFQLILIVVFICLIARAIRHSQFELIAGFTCFGVVFIRQKLVNKMFSSPSARLRVFKWMCLFCISLSLLFSALDLLNVLPLSGLSLAAFILMGLMYSEYRKSLERLEANL